MCSSASRDRCDFVEAPRTYSRTQRTAYGVQLDKRLQEHLGPVDWMQPACCCSLAATCRGEVGGQQRRSSSDCSPGRASKFWGSAPTRPLRRTLVPSSCSSLSCGPSRGRRRALADGRIDCILSSTCRQLLASDMSRRPPGKRILASALYSRKASSSWGLWLCWKFSF